MITVSQIGLECTVIDDLPLATCHLPIIIQPMLAQRICIVGLGLMGGSLAQALAGQVGTLVGTLIGVETHAATRQLALRSGLFSRVTADLESGIADAEVVILATPVSTVLDILAQLPALRPAGCLVLDLGSTKATIGQAMAKLPPEFEAIGGHPMCGKETAGFAAADRALYQGQTFVLCPNERTTPAAEAFARRLVDLIGARPLFLEAGDHDQIVASVSHLPYLVAAALMHLAASQQDDRLWPVSASGFRDTTRLAGSDPRMMLDILLTNKTAVLEQIGCYQQTLSQLETLLESGDATELARWLDETQQQHSSYRRHKTAQAR
jgi:prephenate dehydrogenase